MHMMTVLDDVENGGRGAVVGLNCFLQIGDTADLWAVGYSTARGTPYDGKNLQGVVC
jgi:hypothetical protein